MPDSRRSVIAPVSRLPAAPDPRRALKVYVAARTRALEPEQKRRLVEDAGTESGTEGDPPRVLSSPVADGRGISVPARLDFHRSAGVWRGTPMPDSGRGDEAG